METGFKRCIQKLQHLQKFVWLGDNYFHTTIQKPYTHKSDYLLHSPFSSHIYSFIAFFFAKVNIFFIIQKSKPADVNRIAGLSVLRLIQKALEIL